MEALVDGHLIVGAAGEAAKLAEGLLRLLQLRHRRCSTERFGLYLTTSLDEGGGKEHRWLKGEQQPDAMFSTVFSQLVTDPDQILQEKLEDWTEIWQCNDAQARSKACAVVRKAMAGMLS